MVDLKEHDRPLLGEEDVDVVEVVEELDPQRPLETLDRPDPLSALDSLDTAAALASIDALFEDYDFEKEFGD